MKSFWKNSFGISARLAAAPKLLVTLDFDGTLSALAQTPSQARLEPQFKAALRALAAAPGVSVFILSGRMLGDVRKLTGLRNLYYGGNHGMEIKGPGFAWRDPGAVKTGRLVSAIAEGIREEFPPATGVLVESKVLSASVHYRNLAVSSWRAFLGRMKVLMAARSASLYWRRGKKVFELLPKDAAHKGSAVSRLAAHLGWPLCVAVGDDVTDEDMFEALGADGITVSVGRRSGSKAGYFVAEQTEVLRLLRFIEAARDRGGNGNGNSGAI